MMPRASTHRSAAALGKKSEHPSDLWSLKQKWSYSYSNPTHQGIIPYKSAYRSVKKKGVEYLLMSHVEAAELNCMKSPPAFQRQGMRIEEKESSTAWISPTAEAYGTVCSR